MNTDPIICSGNDLENVLDGIRTRNGVITSLETKVGGHNADYRVSYFERVGENPGAGSSRTPVRQLTASEGENPSALIQLGSVEESDSGIENNDGRRTTRESSERERYKGHAGENPATSKTFPQQGETPEKDIALPSVKGAVAPRNHSNDPKSPCYGSALEQKCPATILRNHVAVGGDETAAVDSISIRLAALQANLLASGKIKRRKRIEARCPYADA